MKKRNMVLKMLSVSLIFSLLLFSLAIFNSFALENQVNNEVIFISSQVELETLAQEVNSGNDFKGQQIKLANDINLTSDELVDGKSISWEPIGYSNLGNKFFKQLMSNFNFNSNLLNRNKSFEGIFDGNGYTINCNINNFEKISGKYTLGAIFGCIGKNGIVKNLNISGKITSKDNQVALAGICDNNFGLIENCNVRANIDGEVGACGICNKNYGMINNCSSKGRITSKDYTCAGISSYNYSSIQNCTVSATIINCVDKGLQGNNKFKNPESAGICSFNYGNISNCKVNSHITNQNLDSDFDYDSYLLNQGKEIAEWNDGSAGGIASTNNGLIENCTVSGSMNAYKLGGIAAKNYESIKDCSVNNKMTGVIVGGVAAQNIAGDNRVSSKFIFWKKSGYLNKCIVSGEINSFFLAGDIYCKDYWDDVHSCVQDCISENLSLKNLK